MGLTASSPVVLEGENLTMRFGGLVAMAEVAFTLKRGEILGIIGPNGAGKSTLLKGIAGVLSPLAGHIDGHVPAREIAYLPQAAEVDRSFPIDVYDLVAMGLWRRSGLFGGIGRADRDRIEHAIAAVGLEGFEARPIGTLSGGQMQRTLFARLLLQDARLILLDEPFTALDAGTVADLTALVERWNGEGRTVIAVLHDLELVRVHFPQTLLLARMPVAWGATREVLTSTNLNEARRMCEAWDDRAPACAPGEAA